VGRVSHPPDGRNEDMSPARAHIAIIGAGPAGSAAAIELARGGVDVVVIESRAFPRVKPCGEFISPAVTAELEALVPAERLRAAGARRVDRFVLEVGEREAAWPLPAPAWALSRGRLDALLLERAREAGARVMQPESVRGVVYGDAGARVRLARGAVVRADAVIHADGSGRHDPAGPVRADRSILGIKCHLRAGRGLEGVRIRSVRGAYVGTIEVEDGLVTCACAVSTRLVRARGGDLDALLAAAWPGYRREWRDTDWKTCPIPRSGYRRPGHARSFRVGNAVAAVDPIGGEGIGLALWSGRLVGRLLARDGVHNSAAFVRAQREVARAYRARLRTRLPACRVAAWALARPWLIRAAWPILTASPAMMGPWFRLTGKARAEGVTTTL